MVAEMNVEVKNYGGHPAIHIDGVPVTGLMTWNRHPSEADAALFRDAGVDFYSFMGNLCLQPEGVPDEELGVADAALERMRLTRENIDRVMTMLTAVNPRIKILPRIVLNAPKWWCKQHPDEVMLCYDTEAGKWFRGPTASPASLAWREEWSAGLVELIEYFESRWGDFIIGYHTGFGHCGEHTYRWWDCVAEYSAPQKAAFQRWLEKKYGSVAVEPPAPERFCRQGARVPALFLPETDGDIIDFQEFASDIMADVVLHEARIVKSTLARLGRRKLCAVFYGYVNLVANSTQSTTGHGALNRILESPDIDLVCGPLSYGARQNGGTVMPQIIPGSIALHGKLFYNEDDIGTHVAPCPHHGYTPADAESCVHALRRNFLETWRSGGSQWWMDLYGLGWFLDESLKREFEQLRKFAENTLADRRSRAEIAVFVSLGGEFYFRDNPVPMTGSLIEQQLFEIGAAGAPFDLFQEEDIPLLAREGGLGQYKLCIFLNSVAPGNEVRDAVKTHLKCRNRTLLWFYLPGYIRNKVRSPDHAADLTGIRFAGVEEGIMPMLTESWIGGNRISYGLTRAVYPRLTANDPAAETLGYYVNGTTIVNRENGDGGALVRKKSADWTSIWSSSPGLPSCLIGQFAREAGVHLFSTRGDQVFYAPGWFGLHSKMDGALTVPFPESFRFENAITGERSSGSTLELELKRGESVLYRLLPVPVAAIRESDVEPVGNALF